VNTSGFIIGRSFIRVRDIVRRMTRFYEKDAGGQRLKTAKEANKILLSK
jgi:hypothetical protein